MPRKWILALLAAALACNDPSEPPPPPDFRLEPLTQWSGGQIAITSAFFSQATTLPTVTASGVPMSLVRLDDSTVQATLPSLPSQDAAITVVTNDAEYSAGTVTVAGFRRRRNVSPGFLWDPIVAVLAGGPYVIAGRYSQPPQGSIAIVDVGLAIARVETGVQQPDLSGGHGVGVSYNPFNMILRDSTGTLGEWQVFPTLAWVDTVASYPYHVRNMARLSHTVWMVSENHQTWILRSTAPDIQVQIEDPYRFHVSTATDRVVLSALYLDGAVVFAMSTGDTVYRLPLNTVTGATFDEGASIMFAMGTPIPSVPNGPDVLIAVNAETGTLLNQLTLPTGLETGSLVYVPGSPGVILIGVRDDGVQGLLVVDQETFAIIGRPSVPDAEACLDQSCALFLSTLAADNLTAWLVSHGEPAPMWEFDILPSD